MAVTGGRELAGVSVLVTRDESELHNGGLTARIKAAGGRAVAAPTVVIAAVGPAPPAVAALARCEIAVFVSRNAVRHGAPLLPRLPGGAALTLAAVGPATAAALQKAAGATVTHPRNAGGSGALLAMPLMQTVRGRRITVVRGAGGLAEPARTLRRRGAVVHVLNCYRRRAPQIDLAPLLTGAGAPAVVTVTSAAHARNLHALAGAAGRAALRGMHFVAPSERVAACCRALGAAKVTVAEGAGAAAMMRALCYISPL
ncbi:MAG: uroporphyrinogen-III synthase [Gammaproteobacteria bacterium]|nr:uroporphyrinogen-III synthase [Gammaproteobacteria bacterium]